MKTKIGCKVSRATQERGRGVDANDFSPALGERKRMPAMTATDVDDPSMRRDLEQLPQARCL
jgi:hypothetical protein